MCILRVRLSDGSPEVWLARPLRILFGKVIGHQLLESAAGGGRWQPDSRTDGNGVGPGRGDGLQVLVHAPAVRRNAIESDCFDHTKSGRALDAKAVEAG